MESIQLRQSSLVFLKHKAFAQQWQLHHVWITSQRRDYAAIFPSNSNSLSGCCKVPLFDARTPQATHGCYRMPEPTEMKSTVSVDGLQLQICTVKAQRRDIMEWGCAGLKATPQGEAPMGLVSERKPTHVIFKGQSQMYYFSKSSDVLQYSHTFHLCDLLAFVFTITDGKTEHLH